MKTRDRKIGLARAASNVKAIAEYLELARARCEERVAKGFASGSGDGVRSSGHSSPTESAAGKRDPFLHDLETADRHLESLIRSSDALVDFIAQYPKAGEATTAIREKLGLREEEWCASCARVPDGTDDQGRPRPWRQPVREATNKAGNMPSEEMAAECGVPRRALCDWCLRFLYEERCWPTVAIVEVRRQGKRVISTLVDSELGRGEGRTRQAG